jgi:hypothetical protein
LAAPAHPLGNQNPLIFRYCPTDLQQQLIVWILTHGSIQKLDLATGPFELFHEQHLMNESPRQPVRAGNQNSLKTGTFNPISQLVQTGSIQARPTVTIVTEDKILRQNLPFSHQIGLQTFYLLLDRLRLRLPVGRYPNIDCRRFHRLPLPPGICASLAGELSALPTGSIPGDVGRLDPTVAPHRLSVAADVEFASSVACSPPEDFRTSSLRFAKSARTPTPARGRRTHLSLTGVTRVRQNLSFVISPLSRTTGR